jgi:protein-tyrosine phosphatase
MSARSTLPSSPEPSMTPADESSTAPVSVLFVCLGNICRSPLAEGVFRDIVTAEDEESRFRVDSAGTGSWHVGDPPDPRSVSVARENGITLVGRARRVVAADLREFDWVIAMDSSNLSTLERMAGDSATARLHLLREFDPQGDDMDVPDPYYGGEDGFQVVYDMVERSCRRLFDHIKEP